MICKYMEGWTYDEVRALPEEVYAVLLEMVQEEHDEMEKLRDK